MYGMIPRPKMVAWRRSLAANKLTFSKKSAAPPDESPRLVAIIGSGI